MLVHQLTKKYPTSSTFFATLRSLETLRQNCCSDILNSQQPTTKPRMRTGWLKMSITSMLSVHGCLAPVMHMMVIFISLGQINKSM